MPFDATRLETVGTVTCPPIRDARNEMFRFLKAVVLRVATPEAGRSAHNRNDVAWRQALVDLVVLADDEIERVVRTLEKGSNVALAEPAITIWVGMRHAKQTLVGRTILSCHAGLRV